MGECGRALSLTVARFGVTHAVGRFDGQLMTESGEPSEASVSVFYQAPAWGDVCADPTADAGAPAAPPS